MIRKFILYFLACAFFSGYATGQKSIHFFPEISLFENINAGDVTREGDTRFLRQAATTGLALSAGFRKDVRKIYLTGMLGFRMSPQKIKYYDAQYPDVSHPENFTNYYSYLELLIGFKIPPGRKQYLDVAAGCQLLYALHNGVPHERLDYVPYTDDATGSSLSYIRDYTYLNWGDTRDKDERLMAPVLTSFVLQAGYNFNLTNGKLLRVALEFSQKISIGFVGRKDNTGRVLVFDRERNQVAREIFSDKHTAIGINLGIGL